MFAPNAIIEKLLQLKKPQAAMTLDALIASDTIKLPTVEISAILHAFKQSGIAIGESIVRRGLFDLAQLGLLATRKIMTRAKGRPAWEYRAGTLQGMAQVLGVELHQNEAKDAIPAQAFKSVKAYRASKHYGFLRRLGRSELSRARLGARLGVSGRSTYNYEAGLTDLTVIAREDKRELNKSDIAAAPEKRGNGNKYLLVEWERELSPAELSEKYNEFDLSQVILKREFTTESQYMPYTRFILARELAKGRKVWLVWQITNEYIVTPKID